MMLVADDTGVTVGGTVCVCVCVCVHCTCRNEMMMDTQTMYGISRKLIINGYTVHHECGDHIVFLCGPLFYTNIEGYQFTLASQVW